MMLESEHFFKILGSTKVLFLNGKNKGKDQIQIYRKNYTHNMEICRMEKMERVGGKVK